jgi:quinoprotein relay system zinc metallohydrolase 1
MRAGRIVRALGLAAALGAGAVAGQAQGVQAPPAVKPAQALQIPDYRLAARALAPGVWVVEGANADFSPANGCNIINTGFIATRAGVLVVNTGPSRLYGEQLRALAERTAGQKVAAVVHLNLHPDYFLGNQAFADVPRWATSATSAGIARESAAYETNLYRLCGDWMKGTETVPPSHELDTAVRAGRWRVGDRSFELIELQGHTASDLVLVDSASGVAFAGGLVFAQRVPTTPHADVPAWRRSLQQLGERQQGPKGRAWAVTVPSHGPVHADSRGLVGTQAYLAWLDNHFSRAAAQGWEMNELLRAPVPPEFRAWAAFDTEYVRNVAHLYPRYERAALLKAPSSGR